MALAACLCYALHGKLAAFSPLVMRDAPFWFLFILTLYLTWRAVVDMRVRWFLAAGAALTLTVHTRTEGWLLLIPWIGWFVGRLSVRGISAPGCYRLVAGTILGLAMIPLSVAIVNVTWLREHPHWELVRADHVQIVASWWHSWSESAAENHAPSARSTLPVPPAPSAPAPTVDTPHEPVAIARNPSGLTIDRKMAGRLIKAYTYVGGLLTLFGVLGHWRLILRRDHLPLALMNLALLATIHIRYSQAGLDLRYFMPIMLISLPWMAMGLFEAYEWIARCTARWLVWTPARRRALAAGLAVLAATGSLADGKLAAGRMMHRHILAGEWIIEHFGPQQWIAENVEGMSLAAYFAKTQRVAAFDVLVENGAILPPAVESGHARVVLLWQEELGCEASIARAQERLCYG